MANIRKIIFVSITILFSILPVLIIINSRSEAKAYALLDESVIRLHILADSNTDEAQAVKIKARDFVIQSMPGLFYNSGTKKEALAHAGEMSGELENLINIFLKGEGAPYSAKVEISRSHFPKREYGGVKFPEGDYDCVKVLLGSAKGHNWWCVLYPPLCCLEPVGEGKISQNGSYFEIKWKISEWWEQLKKENTVGPLSNQASYAR